jgi:hypothetical protein
MRACVHFYTKTPRMALQARSASLRQFRPRQFVARSRNAAMQEQRAREILHSLVQGIDPFNGEELPAGTVLQQAAVLRALLAGVAALEESSERASRRAQLPRNIGRTWNEEEQARLITEFQSGEPLPDIAIRHGRTLRAIEARLEKLGLITPTQRTTRDRFGPRNPPDVI